MDGWLEIVFLSEDKYSLCMTIEERVDKPNARCEDVVCQLVNDPQRSRVLVEHRAHELNGFTSTRSDNKTARQSLSSRKIFSSLSHSALTDVAAKTERDRSYWPILPHHYFYMSFI